MAYQQPLQQQPGILTLSFFTFPLNQALVT